MTVRLWLRDDDSGPADAALGSFLSWLSDAGIPALLAVVPEWLEADAARAIRGHPAVTVAQHGIAHVDHAEAGRKKVELGGTADRTRLREALLRGRERLHRSFGERFLPVLVPPWNRIAPEIERMLPELGYAAVSSFRGRRAPAVPGLLRVDSDIDVIDWRRRRLRPLPELEAELERLCVERRGGPVGILTHHRAEATVETVALRSWLEGLARRPGTEWLDPRELFGGLP